MTVHVDTSALAQMAAHLGQVSANAARKAEAAARRSAEDITATAKGLVYGNGLHYQDGRIRDSLRSVTTVSGGTVTFGVETGYDIAIYHELGTGPVGTASGYPGETMLDTPVVRRSTGWVYWSDAVQNQRMGDAYDAASTYTVLPNEANGFVYTEGVRPKAFMHNALMQEKEDAVHAIVTAMMEEV